ncbi:MAG: hypothetical protein Q8R28_04550 [Dehalococcoidia bacterium]|nr:hypothetical protein [Dehalococcoidia bacterium]
MEWKPIPSTEDRVILASCLLPQVLPPGAGETPCSVVLAEITGFLTPYVTWVFSHRTGEFFWGHYFGELKAAQEDYEKRKEQR